ncbi:MAG: N-6 DNA methylase [Spirochaetales bacterium]|nr:N-6 DNA methylase [Spirochaetales bacterium]
MKYEAINWEGALIGPETLEKIVDENAIKGQKSGDFGLKGKVRDEIEEAWTEAKAQWSLFSIRRAREDAKDAYGTSRTRQSWIIPFFSLLGYELENAAAVEVAGKSFAISHRAAGRVCPVHIVGFNESLDKKRDGPAGSSGRSSPHSLVQEYINLSDTLYALVTNGLTIRLLRDSSRLIKLSYLEFNLERIFEEKRFEDFIVLFRLLHISRWPADADSASECLLEFYHQDSLENGSRIREKLSGAVIDAIIYWAEGLLNHGDNGSLRALVRSDSSAPRLMYDTLLTLVYRVLFLLVIEERNLTHQEGADADLKKLYRDYYSLSSIRERCRSVWSEEGRFSDFWATLLDCFSLHEDGERAALLALKPLAGDLFSDASFALFRDLSMDNASFARGLNMLDSYEDEKRGVPVRVNYAALNVEEFGSIYEGLLDFDARIHEAEGRFHFGFTSGDDRGRSGSHYTPEELVQPLIEHALDPLIEQCLAKNDPEQSLLSLKICDDACGSGHILLNAGRRVALELSRIRTKADNPDPASYGKALRDVIERCIYGVDLNPQAVRLCKVALWLESHNPGESLGFLDHHIKCGDSLVGITQASELLDPIPEAAFAQRDGDDKEFAADLRKRHKKELGEASAKQTMFDWRTQVGENLKGIIETLKTVSNMSDATPEESKRKKEAYYLATEGESWRKLKALADIKLSPFFLPKTQSSSVVTEQVYRDFLNGKEDLTDHPIAEAAASVASTRRFFHWFLEFAEVMQEGGFDCFLGNPPFLGGKRISSNFGLDYGGYLKHVFPEKGSSDLVGFFVRRNYTLLKPNRSLGTLSTNTIAQGDTREVCLDYLLKKGATIHYAVRSRPWPGEAAVEVSLLTIHNATWKGRIILDNKNVDFISSYLDDQIDIGNPYQLFQNSLKSFQGTIVVGEGFILSDSEAKQLMANNPKNRDVIQPYINGDDLNSRSDQSPSRWIINMRDWPYDRATAPQGYEGPVASDYPECLDILIERVKPQRDEIVARGKQIHEYDFWKFWDRRDLLYRTIAPLERVMVIVLHTKGFYLSFVAKEIVFSHALAVFAFDKYTDYSVCCSSFLEYWAWKNSSTLGGGTLRFSPSEAFETFPFPPGFEPNRDLGVSVPSCDASSPLSHKDATAQRGTGAGNETRTSSVPPVDTSLRARLETLGERLDADRREIMLRLDIGLTKLYNLYHNPGISVTAVVKEAKCLEADANWAVEKITALRSLHKTIDETVRDAYGWHDIPLQHGFHELEFLPENDRTRYTISTAARKIILAELLKLNHARHAEEVAAGLVDEDGKVLKKNSHGATKPQKKKKEVKDEGQGQMF